MPTNPARMRNRQLHAALAAFAEEAAWQLASDAANGAEVPFEVVERSGRPRDTPLYCYRPLTGAFIDQRVGILEQLPSYLPAVHALGAAGGLDPYLHARGERWLPPAARERGEAALRVFLTRVFEDSTDFVLTPERLHRAYDELEGILMDGRTETEFVVPLVGLEIESPEVALGDGLTLERGDVSVSDLPQEAIWPRGGGEPRVLAVLRWEAVAGDEEPLGHARVRIRRLLTALRLFDATGIAPGPVAWTRTGGGPWDALVVGSGGLPRGTTVVTAVQEDELRAFCSLISRRTPKSGEIAWALARYEMGCERRLPMHALTDHLMALRALLEPEGPGSGRLPGRLAALCATPETRAAVTERIAHAASLERAVIAGLAPAEIGYDELVGELAGYLRAILRDVVCGHLDSDLRSLADSIISDAVEPATVH